MNPWQTARALIGDTLRQARATCLSWLLLSASLLCIVFCLSIRVEGAKKLHHQSEEIHFLPRGVLADLSERAQTQGVETVGGEIAFLFGAFRVALGRDAEDAVKLVEAVLALFVADTVGVLLALVWTAGFLPSFLQPDQITLLLAKPPPRWQLLVGKSLGVVVFVLLHVALFVVGTGTALGFATGIWHLPYLWCIPLLAVHFVVFFGVSVFLAVVARSTVLCAIGAILAWFMGWGINLARHGLAAAPTLARESTSLAGIDQLTGFCYWLFPKPADLSILLSRATQAEHFFGLLPAFYVVEQQGMFHPTLSILSSLSFAGFLVFVACIEFARTDY